MGANVPARVGRQSTRPMRKILPSPLQISLLNCSIRGNYRRCGDCRSEPIRLQGGRTWKPGLDESGLGESGLGIALKQGKESSAIRLEGVIDIASAAELKAVLLDALKRGKPVTIALDSSAGLDVTAIQLLWAAQREATVSGVGFTLAGPVPARVSATLKEAGFDSFPVPADGDPPLAVEQGIRS